MYYIGCTYEDNKNLGTSEILSFPINTVVQQNQAFSDTQVEIRKHNIGQKIHWYHDISIAFQTFENVSGQQSIKWKWAFSNQ